MEKSNVRQSAVFNLTILALLAALNAAMELTLGNYLHIVRFPFKGSVLVGINIIFYSAGYSIVPRRGTVLSMGIITVLLNLLLGGAWKPLSIIAIMIESVIVELVLGSAGLNTFSVLFAAVMANIFSLAYTISVPFLFFGKGFMDTLFEKLSIMIRSSDFVRNSLAAAGVIVVLIHTAMGALFGWLALRFNDMVQAVIHPRVTK